MLIFQMMMSLSEHKIKENDEAVNKYLPRVMVDTTEVIFDTVKFMEPQIKHISVTNIGKYPVEFEFIQKFHNKAFSKEWLQIEPFTSCIDPGLKCEITFNVFVDQRSAYKMNNGRDKLHDILVLHLKGGKYIFITVTGVYEHSCFGCSLDTLCSLKVPIKDVPIEMLIEYENIRGNLEAIGVVPYEVPKEVWYLVDHLYNHGLKQKHLFQRSGLKSEFIQIRNWLDSGTPDKLSGNVHAAAEALLILLDSTPEPLIPYNLHAACFHAASKYTRCQQIIHKLPKHNMNIFIYICNFLKELLNHFNYNRLDGKTLASIFGEIFIRDPSRSSLYKSGSIDSSRNKTNFMYHFITNKAI